MQQPGPTNAAAYMMLSLFTLSPSEVSSHQEKVMSCLTPRRRDRIRPCAVLGLGLQLYHSTGWIRDWGAGARRQSGNFTIWILAKARTSLVLLFGA